MTALNFHSMRERMKQQLKAEDAQRSSKESPSIFSLPPPIHFNCLTLEEEIRFSVGSIPSVYYIPDFMTRETESLLLKLVSNCLDILNNFNTIFAIRLRMTQRNGPNSQRDD